MKREFLLNILFLVVVNVLIKPFFIFGIDRNVQNLVGFDDYGVYFSLLNLTYITQILSDFGIQNYNNRNISQHSHLLEKYFPSLLALKSLLAIVYIIITFLIAFLCGYPPHYYPLLSVLIANQLLMSLVFFLRSNISGLGYYRIDSLLSVLDKLLMTVLFVVLLFHPASRPHFNLMWFACGQTAALLVTAIISGLLVFRKLRWWRAKLNVPLLLLMLRDSLPYAMVVLLMYAYTRTDAILLERMLPDGKQQSGIYAAAFRLLDAINMVSYLFATLLLPMFSRLLKSREPIEPLLSLSYRIIMTGGLATAVTVIAYRYPIMQLLYTEDTHTAANALAWLMGSFLAFCTFFVYGTLLTANNAQRRMNRIFVVGIIINVGLNILIIPYYKAVGTAAVSCITQIVMTGSLVVLAHRTMHLRLHYRNIAKFVIFTALLAASATILTHTAILWPLQIALLAILAVILTFTFRLVNIAELQQIK